MVEQDLFRYLNQASLVVMAGAFLWLVKTVVNDLKHDVAELLKSSDSTRIEMREMRLELERIGGILERIARNGQGLG